MKNVIIIHGTEGYPEENWFPWLKKNLEERGYNVTVPQFPSPPVVAAKNVKRSLNTSILPMFFPRRF